MSEARKIVLVVGSLHYDIVVETDHLPRKDETAVGRRWYPKFGGKGGNQAVACARAGVATQMVGAIGRDDFGRFLRAGLETAGVDARHVRTLDDALSGMSVAIVDTDGDYAATIVSGANLQISPDWLTDEAIWRGVGLLLLQNEVPESVNLAAATEARRRDVPVILNAAPFRALSRRFSALVDVLVVNAVEAEMMGAQPICSLLNAADAAQDLAQTFDAVIVTAGAMGLAARTANDGAFQLPAHEVAVVSSHGAGDAFLGAFAAALLSGVGFRQACAMAAAAAARHVAGGVEVANSD